MVWVLGAALAAGVTGDLRVAGGALFVFVYAVRRYGLRKGTAGALAATAAVFWIYGHVSIATIRKDIERVESFASRAAGPVTLEGWVCGFPYYRYGGMAFDFETRIDGVKCTVLVRCKEFAVAYGERLRLRGAFKRLGAETGSGGSRRLVGMGVCGDFRVDGGGMEKLPGAAGDWVSRKVLWPCHDRVRQELCRGAGSRSGLPVAVLLGETGFLDRTSAGAFKALGITHLIALSGQHLYFIAGFVAILLRLVGRRSRGALFAAVSLYVAVVGFIVSLWRSFVMVLVLGAASAIKRRIDPVTALADAFVIVLLFYPFTFYSVGFQLSFLATLALLLCVRNLEAPKGKGRWARARFSIRTSIEVSVAAQLIVTPVLIYYFDKVSILSPLATLVFVVPVAFVLLYSGIASLASVVFPAAGIAMFPLLDRAVGLLDRSLAILIGLIPGTVSPPAPEPWVYYGGLAVLASSRKRMRWKAAGLLLVAVSFARELIG